MVNGRGKMEKKWGFLMKNIVTTYLDKAYNDLKTTLAQNNQSNCELSKFSFNNSLPNYTLPINCQFYILKYFPAYLAEYKYIYDMLNYFNFNQFIEQYNVLSIGCGCGIDLLALYLHQLKTPDFKYTGIDLIDWNYRCLFLPQKDNIRFVKADISNFIFENFEKINVIFFPKSIGELPVDIFKNFLNNFSKINFQSKRIAVLISAINPVEDFQKYCDVLSIIKKAGYDYIPNENGVRVINNMYCIKKQYYGINTVVPDFDYPMNIKNNILVLKQICTHCSSSLRNSCPLNDSPVLTTIKWSFNCNILERVN